MAKYAFLFSGGVNKNYNYNRYANDLGFAFKVLTEKLQYLKNDITVMYADGRFLNYNNSSINTTIAKRDGFIAKMIEYSKVVSQNDIFTFVVSNHGDKNGDLCTWNDNPVLRQKIRLYRHTSIQKIMIFFLMV